MADQLGFFGLPRGRDWRTFDMRRSMPSGFSRSTARQASTNSVIVQPRALSSSSAGLRRLGSGRTSMPGVWCASARSVTRMSVPYG